MHWWGRPWLFCVWTRTPGVIPELDLLHPHCMSKLDVLVWVLVLGFFLHWCARSPRA
jgi:hypothetical protein